MAKINKTNAARLLDQAGIGYTLVPYTVDPDDLSAQHIAAQLHEDISMVFKSLVLEGEKAGHFMCVVPGDAEVDLKKAARAAGAKKADLIPMKQLLPLTGYIRGGCTAIGLKKPMPVYVHSSVRDHAEFFVSAGQRGLQLRMATADYLRFTGATVCDLIKVNADE